jgi:hypothetical protein
MPAPLAIPVVGTALGKLGAMLGLGGKAAATQLTIPGLAAAGGKAAASTGTKMAADAAFKKGLGKALFGEMSKGDIVGRLAPDAVFGVMAGAMTPGDMGDKLIAGTTQAAGGGLGGIGLSRAASAAGIGGTGNFLLDMAGSYGGDFAGMAVGDTLQRGKDKLMGGEGQTAFERMGAEQQQRFANQIRNETLMNLGIGPGYLPGVQDQYLAELGLG